MPSRAASRQMELRMGYRRQALRFVIERDERTGWRWQAVLAVAILLFTTLTLPTLAAPALPIRDLDHLSLHVSDVRRSADFYTRLFGTEVSRDPNRQANPGSVPRELWFIRLGDSHLALAPLSPLNGRGSTTSVLPSQASTVMACERTCLGFTNRGLTGRPVCGSQTATVASSSWQRARVHHAYPLSCEMPFSWPHRPGAHANRCSSPDD